MPGGAVQRPTEKFLIWGGGEGKHQGSWASSTAFLLLPFCIMSGRGYTRSAEKAPFRHGLCKGWGWELGFLLFIVFFIFFYFFLCVCVRVQRWNHCHRLGGASSWRISSSGWDCSLCLPFVVHFPWLFLNWSVFQVKAGLRPPPAACKTWQLGWGGRWGDKAVAFDVFLAVLLWWLNFNKSSPRSADHCSQ